MIWVIQAKHIKGFELEVLFNDGKSVRVDLGSSLNGKIFEPLRDVEQFKKFHMNPDLDTISWDNGADFAPEYLYELGLKQAGSSKINAG